MDFMERFERKHKEKRHEVNGIERGICVYFFIDKLVILLKKINHENMIFRFFNLKEI